MGTISLDQQRKELVTRHYFFFEQELGARRSRRIKAVFRVLLLIRRFLDSFKCFDPSALFRVLDRCTGSKFTASATERYGSLGTLFLPWHRVYLSREEHDASIVSVQVHFSCDVSVKFSPFLTHCLDRDGRFYREQVSIAKRNHLAEVRGEWVSRDQTDSNSLCSDYVEHFLRDNPAPGIGWEAGVLAPLLEAVSTEDVNGVADR